MTNGLPQNGRHSAAGYLLALYGSLWQFKSWADERYAKCRSEHGIRHPVKRNLQPSVWLFSRPPMLAASHTQVGDLGDLDDLGLVERERADVSTSRLIVKLYEYGGWN